MSLRISEGTQLVLLHNTDLWAFMRLFLDSVSLSIYEELGFMVHVGRGGDRGSHE
jgi:hypothetical protein